MTCWTGCATRPPGSVWPRWPATPRWCTPGSVRCAGATAPRLLLEVVCARLLLPSASDTESALLQRIERIETRLDISLPAGEAAMNTEASAPARQYVRKTQATGRSRGSHRPAGAGGRTRSRWPSRSPSSHRGGARRGGRTGPCAPARTRTRPAPAASGEPGAAAVRSMWSTVREKVRERSRTTEVMLAGAIVRAVEGNTLVLGHESAPLAKRLSEQRKRRRHPRCAWTRSGWTGGCAGEPGVGAPTAEADPTPEPAPDVVDPQRAEEDSMIAEVDRDAEDPAAPRSRRSGAGVVAERVGRPAHRRVTSVGKLILVTRAWHNRMYVRWTASGRPRDGRRPRGGGCRRGLGPCRGRRCGAAIGGDRRTGRAAVRHRG